MTSRRVTLGGATPLNADPGSDVLLYITNTGNAAIDLGDSNVTAGNGYPLAAGASLPWPIRTSARVYAIGTNGQTVAVIESPAS